MEQSIDNGHDPLAAIYNEGQWRLCKVSPLYNLEYNAVKLKQYASKIRQELTSSVAVNTSVKYAVQIQSQPLLKYREEDADGLMISVSATSEGNKIKVAYVAIFLTWGVSLDLDIAVHLPYMLERGEQRLGTSVRMTLQKIFDCHIKQYSFSQHQLLQFGITFLDHDTSKSSEAFSLLYKIPQAEVNHKLNFSFEIGELRSICNGLKDRIKNTSELVKLSYQCIQNHIYSLMGLDISPFQLQEIALPTAEVKNNGIVKMKTPDIINCVFTLLNEISDISNIQNRDVSEQMSED